jgi:rhodanese-related sulfurtransferase
MDRAEFISEVTEGIQPPPQYFAKNAAINKLGYKSFEEVMAKGAIGLDPEMFEEVANAEDALILDTRKAGDFQAGHIPNSIFIGIDGSFAPWVGTLIVDIKQPILIVAETGREEEVIKRLARVGYDHALGFLEGGFEAWKKTHKPIETVDYINASELKAKLLEAPLQVIDVRKPSEYEASHYHSALNYPLDYINDQLGNIDRKQTYHLHCRSGYRSMVFISILKARGYKKLVDINGGIAAMAASGIPLIESVCSNS